MNTSKKQTLIKRASKTLAVLGLGSAVSYAVADDHMNSEPGAYVGASYGLYKLKDADDFDDDNTALQLILGADFNQYFAIEGSYVDFGDFGGGGYKASVDGFTLAAKGSLPISAMVDLYAKGGVLFWQTDYDVLGFDGDVDGTEPFVGVGASFALAPRLALNIEYVRYAVEVSDDEIEDDTFIGNVPDFETDAKIDQASIGISYKF